MKCLAPKQANEYLARIGMKIGDWNQIEDAVSTKNSESNWINYSAPVKSQELLTFAQYVAGWLPKGDWRLLQIDNSTCLDAVQSSFIASLLFGPEGLERLGENKTFLFEYGESKDDDRNTDLLISNLIFLLLLFECHVHIVSSTSNTGERVAIQDGYIYFISREMDLGGAESLLRNFERQPLMSPPWVIEIIASQQG